MSATPPPPPVDNQSFSGLQRSAQDVGALVEGADFSGPVLEGEGCRSPPRMDVVPGPSTSLAMPGPALTCSVPQLGSPDPDPVPDFGVVGNVIPPPPPPTFRIIDERARPYRNFELLAREVTVLIDPPKPHENSYGWLRDTFATLISHLLDGNVAPHDRVGFTFYSAARVGQRPIGISVRRMDQLSIDVLLQLLERCIQSNEEFLIAGPLRVVLLHVRLPTG